MPVLFKKTSYAGVEEAGNRSGVSEKESGDLNSLEGYFKESKKWQEKINYPLRIGWLVLIINTKHLVNFGMNGRQGLFMPPETPIILVYSQKKI
jgi:hypothetical protein